MKTSPENKTILQKLFKLQTTLKPVTKDARNPAFKASYATLGSVMASIAEAVAAEKLLITHGVDFEGSGVGGSITVTTRLTDIETLECAEVQLTFALPDAGPQKVGSAITYGRRYGMTTLLGLVTEDDDDGNAAQGIKVPQPTPALLTPAKTAAKLTSVTKVHGAVVKQDEPPPAA